jgi:hypothetical protein
MIGISLGIGSSQKSEELREVEIESRSWVVEWIGDLSESMVVGRLRIFGNRILGKLKREKI